MKVKVIDIETIELLPDNEADRAILNHIGFRTWHCVERRTLPTPPERKDETELSLVLKATFPPDFATPPLKK